jgi:hypothetical protein
MLSSIIDVTAKVLLMDRDPPAMPHEGLLEAPDFHEPPLQARAGPARTSEHL